MRASSLRWSVWLGATIVALALSILVWLVNVEAAVQYAYDDVWLPGQRILPSRVYQWLLIAAVDLSTISTLLPLLYFGFVAYGFRRKMQNVNLPWWVDGHWIPFPPYFMTFNLWMGLIGTLLGLLVGLPTPPGDGSAIDIQQALGALIAGFKTSVVSTIVGITVAGLVVPTAGLFRRYLFEPKQSPTASKTLDQMREHFQQMMDVVALLLRSLIELNKHSSTTAQQLKAIGEQLAEVKATLGVEYFQQIQQRQIDQCALTNAQNNLIGQVLQFLQDAHGLAVSQAVRDRRQEQQHLALLDLLSRSQAYDEVERQRLIRAVQAAVGELVAVPRMNGFCHHGVNP